MSLDIQLVHAPSEIFRRLGDSPLGGLFILNDKVTPSHGTSAFYSRHTFDTATVIRLTIALYAIRDALADVPDYIGDTTPENLRDFTVTVGSNGVIGYEFPGVVHDDLNDPAVMTAAALIRDLFTAAIELELTGFSDATAIHMIHGSKRFASV